MPGVECRGDAGPGHDPDAVGAGRQRQGIPAVSREESHTRVVEVLVVLAGRVELHVAAGQRSIRTAHDPADVHTRLRDEVGAVAVGGHDEGRRLGAGALGAVPGTHRPRAFVGQDLGVVGAGRKDHLVGARGEVVVCRRVVVAVVAATGVDLDAAAGHRAVAAGHRAADGVAHAGDQVQRCVAGHGDDGGLLAGGLRVVPGLHGALPGVRLDEDPVGAVGHRGRVRPTGHRHRGRRAAGPDVVALRPEGDLPGGDGAAAVGGH